MPALLYTILAAHGCMCGLYQYPIHHILHAHAVDLPAVELMNVVVEVYLRTRRRALKQAVRPQAASTTVRPTQQSPAARRASAAQTQRARRAQARVPRTRLHCALGCCVACARVCTHPGRDGHNFARAIDRLGEAHTDACSRACGRESGHGRVRVRCRAQLERSCPVSARQRKRHAARLRACVQAPTFAVPQHRHAAHLAAGCTDPAGPVSRRRAPQIRRTKFFFGPCTSGHNLDG